MLDHVAIQCGDMTASAAFYDAVLAPLGVSRLMDFEVAVGFGTGDKPDFWIGKQSTGKAGTRQSRIHAA